MFNQFPTFLCMYIENIEHMSQCHIYVIRTSNLEIRNNINMHRGNDAYSPFRTLCLYLWWLFFIYTAHSPQPRNHCKGPMSISRNISYLLWKGMFTNVIWHIYQSVSLRLRSLRLVKHHIFYPAQTPHSMLQEHWQQWNWNTSMS